MSAAWPIGWALRLLPGGAADPEPIHGARPLDSVAPQNERPYVGTNMVATVDGRIELNGTAAGLGSPSDQYLMRVLRAGADAVMHGAATLRAEKFKPGVPEELVAERLRLGMPPNPLGVVVTGSGVLPPDHPYLRSATPEWPRVILTTNPQARSLERPGVEVWVEDAAVLNLAGALRRLGERGVRKIMCEGGPTLNGSLLRAGLLDELFLTQAARIVGGGDAPRIVMSPPLPPTTVAVRSLYLRDEELFVRYGVRAASG